MSPKGQMKAVEEALCSFIYPLFVTLDRETQEEIHGMNATGMMLIEGMDHEKYCQLCHLLQVADLNGKWELQRCVCG